MVEPRPEPETSGSANVVPIRPPTRARGDGVAYRPAERRPDVEWSGDAPAVLADDRLIEDVRAGRVSPADTDPVAALLAFWRQLAWSPRAVAGGAALPCRRRRTG
ncbi:MAG: hypothetical protein OJJ54_02475 [Pseudonocardia sp.]|nr:hypothetical protein [Pseudonocardia sp.]